MWTTTVTRPARMVAVASLLCGPALLAASTFAWTAGRYGATGGLLVAVATPLWAPGLLALWTMVRHPVVAALGQVLLLVGVAGGVAFGIQGVFEQALGLSAEQSVAALDAFPAVSVAVFRIAGPAFPLSLVLLGGLLAGERAHRLPGLLLAVGGIAFPLSRVSRAEPLAHLADLVLLAASAWLAWALLRSREAG